MIFTFLLYSYVPSSFASLYPHLQRCSKLTFRMNEKPKGKKCCDGKKDGSDRGKETRGPMNEMKEGTGCNQFEPKLLATVKMGDDTEIDLKIARSGVQGNTVKTDRALEILKSHLTPPMMDRMALRILR